MENLFEENGLIYSDETKKVIVGVADGFNPTELVIPEGVETIKSEAFASLKDLEKLTLPTTLKELESNFLPPKYDFFGFDETDEDVAADVVRQRNEPHEVEIIAPVYESLNLYGDELGLLDGFGKIPVKKVILKDEIVEIGVGVFENWTHLEEVIVEDDLDDIETSAFEGCINLKSVTFNGEVRLIQARAFLGCDKLERINMPWYTIVERTYFKDENGDLSWSDAPSLQQPGAFDGKNAWRNWFVDLGLPSGTLWSRKNIGVEYDITKPGKVVKAMDKLLIGKALPTIDQMLELHNECEWRYSKKLSAFKVVGPNGEAIILPFPKDKIDEPMFAAYHCAEDELPIFSEDGSEVLGFTKTPDVERYIREVGTK